MSNPPTLTDEQRSAQKTLAEALENSGAGLDLLEPAYEAFYAARNQVDDVIDEVKAVARAGYRSLVTVLTKKMAEDLTEYMHEQGVRVRYMHSDVDTMERIEILRDLRLGVFDVLIGINLLREGLDIPEVSLVAILDADKEGFLRSERSLIQTIGRAARNLQGRAILYADKITNSMKRAIDETERRRNKQLAFNEANGIVPQGINKKVRDLIDGVYGDNAGIGKRKSALSTVVLDEKALAKEIKRIEKEMLEAARNLEFEKAANLRDQLKVLKEQAWINPL